MNAEYIRSQYAPAAVGTGIVHLGLGAFVRAHLAVYTEKLLNLRKKADDDHWGICGVNIRSNRQIVDQLRAQDLRYTVAEYESEQRVTLREVSSIREVLYAGGGDTAPLLARLADPQVRIVSLTVTEKGYCLDMGSCQLIVDHPGIQNDLANPEAPVTVPGILVAGLKIRRDKQLPAFTVMSCDNMPSNGAATRQAVLQLARRLDLHLATWISEHVCFPSTMVDRIVPAATPESTARVRGLLSEYDDQVPVACEAFSQWIIEDRFVRGRPDWAAVGATFVADVAPWENMKLRMLNGSHSLLAYLGNLGGLEYVSDCMQQPEYVQLLKIYMLHEAVPTLDMPEGTDFPAYVTRLLARFANDSLRHRTAQIAMDGSQKIPQRWLSGAQLLLQRGVMPKTTALGIAGWIRYVSGEDESGNIIAVSDPLSEQLQVLANPNQDAREIVDAFFRLSMFNAVTAMPAGNEFADLVARYLLKIRKQGARAAVGALVKEFSAPSDHRS